MAEREQEFVEYVVKALVEKPESVEVKRSLDQKGVFLELSLDPEDVGKVIGKKGATINAIRSLLRVLGAKYDARYSLKVIEPEGYRRSESADEEVGDAMGESSMAEPSDMTAESPSEDTAAEANQASETTADAGTTDEADQVDEIKSKAKEGLEDLDDLDI